MIILRVAPPKVWIAYCAFSERKLPGAYSVSLNGLWPSAHVQTEKIILPESVSGHT